MMEYTLTQIAKQINATLCLKDSNKTGITGVHALKTASSSDISFCADERFSPLLATTQAAAVILSENDVDKCQTNALIMDNPLLGFAKVAAIFSHKQAQAGIHTSAVVEKTATVHATACIGAKCVIGSNVDIAEGVTIDAGVVIQDNVNIEAHTHIKANVTLCHDVIVGRRCIIDCGSVIGADGFGNVQEKGCWYKIPQLGTVIISDDVHIGANTTVDRGALANTEIHNGVRLDNQIQIAHNVIIGEHTAIAAGTGIAGSTVIGKACQIGGLVGIGGHLTITDNVMLTGMTMVTKSILTAGAYSSGIPARKREQWHKNIACLQRITHLLQRIKKLEKFLGLTAKGDKK